MLLVLTRVEGGLSDYAYAPLWVTEVGPQVVLRPLGPLLQPTRLQPTAQLVVRTDQPPANKRLFLFPKEDVLAQSGVYFLLFLSSCLGR